MALGRFGPVGGPGGSPFDDSTDPDAIGGVMEEANVRLAEIIIRSDQAIDSIQAVYADMDQPLLSLQHGGNGGSAKSIKFQKDEKLIAIDGFVGSQDGAVVIKGLSFVSNQQVHGPFGQSTSAPFSLEAPDGSDICGFFGRSGKLLDALGVCVRTPG